MGAVLVKADTRDPVWDEHEAILQSINEGRAEDAERLSRKHGEFGGKAVSARMAPAADEPGIRT